MTSTSYLEINLKQLATNLQGYRSLLPEDVNICAVVKADAYGLGLAQVVKTFVDQKINMLAVFSPEQAATLLAIAPPCPILILMPVSDLPDNDIFSQAIDKGQLHLTVHYPGQLTSLNQIGRKHNVQLPIHLYIDTGMSRAGLSQENLDIVFSELPDCANLKLTGIYTHFTSAENDPDFTERQQNALFDMLEKHQQKIASDTIIHTANSYAALRGKSFANNMIRIGLGLYGYAPQTMEPISPAAEKIKPIVRWMSQIEHVDQYPAGRTVGYNRTYTLENPARLAMVPVGYGDGYPTSLSNKSTVRVQLISGKFVDSPIRGRVNMDQITIDLTDLPAEITVGTPVEIYSNEITPLNALHKLAQLADHNCYELLCQLSPRIERRYT